MKSWSLFKQGTMGKWIMVQYTRWFSMWLLVWNDLRNWYWNIYYFLQSWQKQKIYWNFNAILFSIRFPILCLEKVLCHRIRLPTACWNAVILNTNEAEWRRNLRLRDRMDMRKLWEDTYHFIHLHRTDVPGLCQTLASHWQAAMKIGNRIKSKHEF